MGKPVEMEMPPLTPLSVMPLHPEGTRDYWGCALPFGVLPRLDVRSVEWDWRCPGCVAKAAEYVANGVDPELPWTRTPGAEPIMVQLSRMVERSSYYLMMQAEPAADPTEREGEG